MPVKLIVEVTDSLAVGNAAKRENKRLQRQIELQTTRIAYNDSVIHSQEREIATNAKRLSANDIFIEKQNTIIYKLNKDAINQDKYARRGKKQFVIDIGPGYGYQFGPMITRGPSLGIHVGKIIARF